MWNFLIALLALAFYYYRSPYFHKIDPVSYNVALPVKLEGPLSPNTKLEAAERLHENSLHWPEAFAVHNDKIYTGLGDGRIVEVLEKSIKEIVRTGKNCGGQHEEHICGRPLGMTFNSKGDSLYVADAYYGIVKVDVKSGNKVSILPSKTVVNGSPLTFLNNIALDEKEQVLYVTQSSTKWNISHVIVSIMEHESSGRLLKYDLKTKAVSVILKDLSFPNGVQLTHDGNALLIAEGNNHGVIKYHIRGEKKGTKSVLPLVLPGEPDNISRNKRGNYWVSVASGRSQENPTFLDMLAEKPIIRKIVLFAHKACVSPVAVILNFLPYDWAKELAYEIDTFRIIADYTIGHGLILEFNDNGKILQSLHSPSGKVTHISEVLEHKGFLYLGSWRNHYIGRVKL